MTTPAPGAPAPGGPAPGGPAPGGPVLGLDLGQARIGVAVSDPDRRVAVPVGTVRTGAPQDLRAIAALVREHGATEVAVGHPLRMAGGSGEAATQAETFAATLRELLGIPVTLVDERLSTVQAERELARAGVRGRDRRAVVDQTAATVILQSYLDRLGSSDPARSSGPDPSSGPGRSSPEAPPPSGIL
jgi:putative holliday junction resolvase